MNLMIKICTFSFALLAMIFANATPSFAFPLKHQTEISSSVHNKSIHKTQSNRWRRGYRTRKHRGIGVGGAAALGLGLGVLGAIAAQNAARARGGVVVEEVGPPVTEDAIDYCIRRFRSYNPETGLYRGYDGRLRPCP